MPLTTQTPKCLVDISGKTTLSNILKILEEFNVSGIFYIVCGHAS
jgi:NDP-sugar pyrophosphorylase family protein